MLFNRILYSKIVSPRISSFNLKQRPNSAGKGPDRLLPTMRKSKLNGQSLQVSNFHLQSFHIFNLKAPKEMN